MATGATRTVPSGLETAENTNQNQKRGGLASARFFLDSCLPEFGSYYSLAHIDSDGFQNDDSFLVFNWGVVFVSLLKRNHLINTYTKESNLHLAFQKKNVQGRGVGVSFTVIIWFFFGEFLPLVLTQNSWSSLFCLFCFRIE